MAPHPLASGASQLEPWSPPIESLLRTRLRGGAGPDPQRAQKPAPSWFLHTELSASFLLGGETEWGGISKGGGPGRGP